MADIFSLSIFGIYSRYITATVADLIKAQQLFSYSPPEKLINWIDTHTSVLAPLTRDRVKLLLPV